LPEFPLGKKKGKKEKIRVLPRNTGGGKIRRKGINFGKSRFWLLTGFAVRDIFNLLDGYVNSDVY
jgi:hypothetical protein